MLSNENLKIILFPHQADYKIIDKSQKSMGESLSLTQFN